MPRLEESCEDSQGRRESSTPVGTGQRPDFDELDAFSVQHAGDFVDRGTSGDDVVDYCDMLIDTPWLVGKCLTHIAGALLSA